MLAEKINTADIDVIEMLNSTAADAMPSFLASNKMKKPPNEYGKLDIDKVTENIRMLDQVCASAEFTSLDSYDRLVADMIVDYYRKKNIFVEACYNYNNCTSKEKEEAAVSHRKANIALYGEPDMDIFLSLVEHELGIIRSMELTKQESLQIRELEELTSELPLSRHKYIEFYPSKDILERFSDIAESFFEPFLRHIPEQDSYTVDECADIINEILNTELSGYKKSWEAVVEPNRTNAAVDHMIYKVLLPRKMDPPYYTPNRLRSIIVHELGVHVMRTMPYEEMKLKAFSFGFPGYEETEEGIAKILEQGITRQLQRSGIFHYISIGLAHIMRYDFRKVFEIQKRLLGLSMGFSEVQCFNAVQRAFRGTGELSNNKDLVYFNGTQRVWKYIEEHIDDPTLFDDLLLSAKSDFLSPLQSVLIYEAHCGRKIAF